MVGVVQRYGPAHDAFSQRFTAHQLEHQCGDTIRVFQSVDGADVWMIERREHARFAFEPGKAIRIAGEGPRQELDRHVSAQSRIASAIDLAHAAHSDALVDLIDPEAPTGKHRSGIADQFRHVGHGRTLEKATP